VIIDGEIIVEVGAVRLALTSGRTRREIAEDLGIGLSTLTRWVSDERDSGAPVEPSSDVHAELKRLRRENAVLTQERDLAMEAPRRAIANRAPSSGLVHHSDRGSQYCSVDYQAVLRKRGILISMSGKGNCYDNAMVDAFFKTIKSDLIWPVAWQTRQQAENAIARYTDGFYNPVRRHSALGFQSPIAFEREAQKVS
jgi:transposase-like protein